MHKYNIKYVINCKYSTEYWQNTYTENIYQIYTIAYIDNILALIECRIFTY